MAGESTGSPRRGVLAAIGAALAIAALLVGGAPASPQVNAALDEAQDGSALAARPTKGRGGGGRATPTPTEEPTPEIPPEPAEHVWLPALVRDYPVGSPASSGRRPVPGSNLVSSRLYIENPNEVEANITINVYNVASDLIESQPLDIPPGGNITLDIGRNALSNVTSGHADSVDIVSQEGVPVGARVSFYESRTRRTLGSYDGVSFGDFYFDEFVIEALGLVNASSVIFVQNLSASIADEFTPPANMTVTITFPDPDGDPDTFEDPLVFTLSDVAPETSAVVVPRALGFNYQGTRSVIVETDQPAAVAVLSR